MKHSLACKPINSTCTAADTDLLVVLLSLVRDELQRACVLAGSVFLTRQIALLRGLAPRIADQARRGALHCGVCRDQMRLE
jgi:hypothetical protein